MSDSGSGRGMEQSLVNYRPRGSYDHPKLIDHDRNTRLHYLAAKDDVEGVIEYLEKESSVVDPENYMGWTPLMMACRKGHFETVKCLVKYRANTTMKNKFGMNVFQMAIASGNLSLVEYLLNYLLTGGVSRRFLERLFPVASLAVLFKHQSILEYVISNHFSINDGTPETKITPFMFAHAMENNAAIATLLENKVDTKATNHLGHTATDIANIRNQMKINHTLDHATLTRKLAEAYESLENEMQNQQLRNVLQVNPASPSSVPVLQPQMPYIVLSPYNGQTEIKYLTVPNQMMAFGRRSSNISPCAVPSTPMVSPISPVFGHQVFFPHDFSPSHIMTLQEYNFAAARYNNSREFLNVRLNSSEATIVSSPNLINNYCLSPAV